MPRLAGRLTLTVPKIVAVGAPEPEFPWFWLILRWIPRQDERYSDPSSKPTRPSGGGPWGWSPTGITAVSNYLDANPFLAADARRSIERALADPPDGW